MAFLKAHLLWTIVGLVAAWYFFVKKPSGPATSNAPGSVLQPTFGKNITAIVNSQGPGMAAYDTNPANYRMVEDQVAYPGWYRSTVDGSWYKPDTDEFYSAGSSPVSMAPYLYAGIGDSARPVIDLTVPTQAPLTAQQTADRLAFGPEPEVY